MFGFSVAGPDRPSIRDVHIGSGETSDGDMTGSQRSRRGGACRVSWVVAGLLLGVAHSAAAQEYFAADLNRAQVVNNESFSTAFGRADFVLTDTLAGPQLAYTLSLTGLDLDPDPGQRTDPNDVVGVHMHLHVPGVIGPHILNIFGNPSEDDADLVVDFDAETLTGVFDLSDASRDPDTGELLPQAFPLTTKVIDNWLDELRAGELYIAVHSMDRAMNAPPGVDIRGNIFAVPEPASACWLAAGPVLLARRRCRRRRRGAERG